MIGQLFVDVHNVRLCIDRIRCVVVSRHRSKVRTIALPRGERLGIINVWNRSYCRWNVRVGFDEDRIVEDCEQRTT